MTYDTVSDELIGAARLRVRMGSSLTFDSEIRELIAAARADLVREGITTEKVMDENDPLIRRALMLYVKAEFGLNNPDSEKYKNSYETLKRHLALSCEYTGGDA